jgi:hypothetical protein
MIRGEDSGDIDYASVLCTFVHWFLSGFMQPIAAQALGIYHCDCA